MQLKERTELQYKCIETENGVNRTCSLFLFASQGIMRKMVRKMVPEDEALRPYLPEILLTAYSGARIERYKAPPLVLVRDDDPLIVVAPDLHWHAWLILEVCCLRLSKTRV